MSVNAVIITDSTLTIPTNIDLAEFVEDIAKDTISSKREKVFTQIDLTVADLFIYEHNIGSNPSSTRIINNLGAEVFPDIEDLTVNVLAINLLPFTPITGTWRIIING